MDDILGIDLGTTNSEVAVIRDGKPVVLEDAGDPILPSVVGLGPDGKLLVGRAAQNQWVLDPERTIRSIKRKMGESTKVKLGDAEYSPPEISAMILKKLRDRAAANGVTTNKAVITVPAYFNDDQRTATRAAGEMAGLEVVRILNEPTAAALAYDPHRVERRHVLVYDLGGGTFDVSIVLAEAGIVEVLSSHGDTKLGGDDFDELLCQLLYDRFEAKHGVKLEGPAVRARLLRAAEAAKRQLSDHAVVTVEEEFLAEKDGVSLHLSEEIQRYEYEALIEPLLKRTIDCLRRALEDAKLDARLIDEIVLVGGSTRTPLVSQMLEDRLGKPARREVNPDLIVAMGAALQGGLAAGQDVGAVLVDITPHSLGIRCVEGGSGYMFNEHLFSVIIPRNTPLPANRSEMYRTMVDNQKIVDIQVYQGEDDDVRNNHSLGQFRIEDLAPGAAGQPIVVQFELTLDGVLKVSAREKSTGHSKNITIANATAGYSHEARARSRTRLDEMWADSYGLPSDNPMIAVAEPELAPGPMEGAREAVQAKALLEKAERLMERVVDEDRGDYEKLMTSVRTALQDRDWSRLGKTSNELADALFYIEDA